MSDKIKNKKDLTKHFNRMCIANFVLFGLTIIFGILTILALENIIDVHGIDIELFFLFIVALLGGFIAILNIVQGIFYFVSIITPIKIPNKKMGIIFITLTLAAIIFIALGALLYNAAGLYTLAFVIIGIGILALITVIIFQILFFVWTKGKKKQNQVGV